MASKKATTTDVTLAPDPQVLALKTRATKLFKAWKDIAVTDTVSFEKASIGVKEAVALRKDLKDLPVYVELAKAKKDIKEKEKLLKEVDRAIEQVEDIIRNALSTYAAKQRAAQEVKVEKAIEKGQDVKAAAILATPFVPVVPGVSFTEHWHAEIQDLLAFTTWASSKGKDTVEAFLLPNLVALNARARDLKAEDIAIPGVKGVKETSSKVSG